MSFKKALMCGAMACVMLFTGCKEDNSSSYTTPEASLGADVTSEGVSKPASLLGSASNVTDVTPKSGDLIATFEIEGYGEIKAVLFPDAAPVGVENFQKLCDAGYYKGLNIHRVISEFMFQGGSANGDGTGGEAMVNGGKFSIETSQNVRHFYGALCYANAGADNNSTQFYIVNNKQAEELDAPILEDNIEYAKGGVEYFTELGDLASAAYYEQRAAYYQTMLDWYNSQTAEIKERYREKGGTPSLDGNYTVFGQVYEGFDVIDAISAVEVEENASGELSKPVKDLIIKNVSVSTFE